VLLGKKTGNVDSCGTAWILRATTSPLQAEAIPGANLGELGERNEPATAITGWPCIRIV
jgi:hypothetical protein